MTSQVSRIKALISAVLYFFLQSFVSSFSEAIDLECRSSGITVQTITPGAVSSDTPDEDIHQEGKFYVKK